MQILYLIEPYLRTFRLLQNDWNKIKIEDSENWGDFEFIKKYHNYGP